MRGTPDVDLRDRLDALMHGASAEERLRRDPLRFVRAWDDPGDQEVAGVLASALSFGRVAAFTPAIAALMDEAAAAGGPRAWALGFDGWRSPACRDLRYRWIDADDLGLLVRALQPALRAGRLGDRMEAAAGDSPDLGPGLGRFIAGIRADAEAAAGRPWEALPRGFRSLLASPAEGSACKRWCMLLRWMVRRPGPGPAGVDLGIWRLSPARLVIPLDTHVHRTARLLGLTDRADGSWRTAAAITAALRALDPEDPLRYDFAIAHLGISGGCRGELHPPSCGPCPLQPRCAAGAALAGAG